MRWIKALIVPVFLFTLLFIAACDDGGGKEKDKILTFAGSEPVGDFVVIQLNKTDRTVRRINYTNPDDSGWLTYFLVPATHENAQGFSILKRVDFENGDYILFAEFPNTALVYQRFLTSDAPDGYPVYVVLRDKVDKAEYSEKAYNWIKMKIGGDPVDAEMEAGFAAFDTYVEGSGTYEGLLYGAGFNSEEEEDVVTHGITPINDGSSMISSFVENTELIANTMWTGTVGDMDSAITITGTESGTNIIAFGPGQGGGMGLVIPQSDVTLAEAAGTYFVLCYESDKVANTENVQPIKVVLSTESGGTIRVFQYEANTTVPDDLILTDTLTALASLPAGESPGGAITINEQFETAAGNNLADSATVQDAHLCPGVFVASDGDSVITVSIDPLGNFFGFTMLDGSGANDIVRFGFGIKDDGYANLP